MSFGKGIQAMGGSETRASGKVKGDIHFVTYIFLYYLNLFKKIQPKGF